MHHSGKEYVSNLSSNKLPVQVWWAGRMRYIVNDFVLQMAQLIVLWPIRFVEQQFVWSDIDITDLWLSYHSQVDHCGNCWASSSGNQRTDMDWKAFRWLLNCVSRSPRDHPQLARNQMYPTRVQRKRARAWNFQFLSRLTTVNRGGWRALIADVIAILPCSRFNRSLLVDKLP